MKIISASVPLWKAVGCLLVLAASTHGNTFAQHDPYEVLFNGTVSQEMPQGVDRDQLIFTSEELFLRPLSGEVSLFNTVTGNSFVPVRYSRAGVRREYSSVMLMGLDISGNLNAGADYNLWSSLRRSRLVAGEEADARDFSGGSVLPSRISYEFNAVSVPERTSVGMFATDRKGRLGLKAATSGAAGENWTYMLDIYRRWGRDATVKGVFTDRLAYSAGFSGSFGSHRITVFSAGDYSEDGLRSYITKEAAQLAGTNYYNPSWGYQDGKVRNSRVAKGIMPLTVISYHWKAGKKFTLAASVGYSGGEKSVSGLSWLDAATPYPDYYRYMPSYASSNVAATILTDKWASGDTAVTQMDWNGLYGINSSNSKTAVYTLSDMVEGTRDIQSFIGASVKINENTVANLSLRGRKNDVRRFRRMKDLLGGIAPDDIDQYLYEDELYGDKVLNNVSDPYRKVNGGDVFGYDYVIDATQVEGNASVAYTAKGWKIDVSVSYAHTAYSRNGRFEKEIYPGNLSLGKSDKVRYETFTGEAKARYAFDGIHNVTAYAYAGRSPQPWAVHFITPRYSNKLTGVDKPLTNVYAQGGYMYRSNIISASVSLFYSQTSGRSEIYNYWDDISSTYSAMLLENIGEQNRGVELAVDYNPHPRWNVSGAFSIGSYKYSTDPNVTIWSENTLENYVSGAVSYLKGYHSAVSPEIYFTSRLKYSASGFISTLSVNHAAGRYVSPSPLRRMQRAFNLASSAEGLEDFVSQEKLGGSFTLDISVLKSFRINANYLSLFISVNNLLNSRETVYGGYEQLRIAKMGSGINATWTPFANKYLYAYGRSYYCSVTFTF